MLVQVKVPALSESVAEATLLSWHKKQGDFVNRDENLIDLETDKVVLELPAPNSGVLKKIVVDVGNDRESIPLLQSLQCSHGIRKRFPAADRPRQRLAFVFGRFKTKL